MKSADVIFVAIPGIINARITTQQRIVAGLFEVTFAQPNCDTIRVTDLCFDNITK